MTIPSETGVEHYHILVVVASTIDDTGRLGPGFISEAEVPQDMADQCDQFGYFHRTYQQDDRDAIYRLRINELVREEEREPSAETVMFPSIRRLQEGLFAKALQSRRKATILLMSEEDYPIFEDAAHANKVEFITHRFNGELRTSYDDV